MRLSVLPHRSSEALDGASACAAQQLSLELPGMRVWGSGRHRHHLLPQVQVLLPQILHLWGGWVGGRLSG